MHALSGCECFLLQQMMSVDETRLVSISNSSFCYPTSRKKGRRSPLTSRCDRAGRRPLLEGTVRSADSKEPPALDGILLDRALPLAWSELWVCSEDGLDDLGSAPSRSSRPLTTSEDPESGPDGAGTLARPRPSSCLRF